MKSTRLGPAGKIAGAFIDSKLTPLFLVAASSQLPLAFFPLFTQAADNPLTWLDLGVVISLPIAGYQLAILLGSPYARPLAVRFGYRAFMLLVCVPTIAAYVGLYFATNVIEIIVFRTLSGFGYATVMLACQDYVLDVAPKEQRSRSLGIYSGVLFAGVFSGTAMGGVLADRLGQSTVFLVSAALMVVAGLLVFRLVPGRRARLPDEQIPADQPPVEKSRVSIWAPLANPRFAALVLGVAIPANVVLQAFVAYLATLYLSELGASAADIGRTLMGFFLTIALMGPATARLTASRFDPALMTLAGAGLCGIALLAGALWGTQLGMLVAILGAGLGQGMSRGPQISVALSIAESDHRQLGSNAALGSLRTMERAGSIIGLVLIAFASSHIGYPAAIGVVAVWVLAGAVAFVASLAEKNTSPPSRAK